MKDIYAFIKPNKITWWALTLLCLFSGCSGPAYLFPAGTGASVSYRKARQQQEAVVSEIFAPTDSAEAGEDVPLLASLEELPVEDFESLPAARLRQSHVPQQSPASAVVMLKAQKKQQPGVQQPDKPGKKSKLAGIGFFLSLAGLGSLLLGGVLPVFFTVGFIAAVLGTVFSRVALREIKEDPQLLPYRRKARIGFVLGLVTLGLYVVAMLAFLIILAAWSAG